MLWQDLVSLISSFLKMPHLPNTTPSPLAAPSPQWSALFTPSEWPEACQVYPTQGASLGLASQRCWVGAASRGSWALSHVDRTCHGLCVGSESSNVG